MNFTSRSAFRCKRFQVSRFKSSLWCGFNEQNTLRLHFEWSSFPINGLGWLPNSLHLILTELFRLSRQSHGNFRSRDETYRKHLRNGYSLHFHRDAILYREWKKIRLGWSTWCPCLCISNRSFISSKLQTSSMNACFDHFLKQIKTKHFVMVLVDRSCGSRKIRLWLLLALELTIAVLTLTLFYFSHASLDVAFINGLHTLLADFVLMRRRKTLPALNKDEEFDLQSEMIICIHLFDAISHNTLRIDRARSRFAKRTWAFVRLAEKSFSYFCRNFTFWSTHVDMKIC